MALLAEALRRGRAVARGLVVVAPAVLWRLLVASATPVPSGLCSADSVPSATVPAGGGLAVARRRRAALVAVEERGQTEVTSELLLLATPHRDVRRTHPDEDGGGGCC